jgi:REP element-mobilizing transposase RayT
MSLHYRDDTSHTHASVLVHCIFSTKQRANIIPDCDALWRYIAVLAQDNKILLLAAGGTANHLHLLMAVPPVLPLAKAIQELKGSSSSGCMSMDTVLPGRRVMVHSVSANRRSRR